MGLSPGTRLGPYEIVSPIGAGGMGEVYRARDVRLKRDVAIKILPAALSGDPERVQRLEREAQLLASLNHRGIATIHGLEESAHGLALVMELVSGRTLARLIEDSAAGLPLEVALPIATQIADALDAAHERGVIHRDLKPANVMCAPDGAVKVLDFGLAKALVPAGGQATGDPAQSPTMTAQGTMPGLILGTAAYMAPEQARGLDVDRRVDVWAFGAVLFEMLTGRRAFDGRDATEVIAHVIAKEPDWALLPVSTPPALRRLLRRCLQKDPGRRLHDIADARLELEDARTGTTAESDAKTQVARPPAHRGSVIGLVATAAALAIAAFVIGWWLRPPRSSSSPEWIGERLGGSTIAMVPSVSPDGQTIAFLSIINGLTQVSVMKPPSGNWTVLTKERGRGLTQHVGWSRDGSSLIFDRYLDVPNGIYSVPLFGGDERLLLENAITPRSLPDGSLLFARINADRNVQLHRFWPETGRVEALPAFVAALSRVTMPAVDVFPDGREVVYVGRPAGETEDHLWVLDLASGKSRRIAPDVTLVYTSFSFPMTASADGQSVLFTLPSGNTHPIVSVARDGSPGVRTVLPLIQRPVAMDMGPDGSLIVDQLDQPSEIFQFDPASRHLERIPMPATLTLELSSALPLADGRLLFGTRTLGRDRLVVMSPGKEPVPLIATEEETAGPMATLGDDAVVLFAGTPPKRQLAVASISGGRIVSRFAQVDGNQTISAVAGLPDGKTVFYVAAGSLWTVSGANSAPRRIRGGDGVAVAPDGRSLIVMLNEAGGIRLIRHDLQTGTDENVPLAGARIAPWSIAPNAVGRDGRLALRVISPDSWFWPAAILDPRTGRLEVLPEAAVADMLTPGWDAQGRVVTVATLTRSTLWRFRVRGGK